MKIQKLLNHIAKQRIRDAMARDPEQDFDLDEILELAVEEICLQMSLTGDIDEKIIPHRASMTVSLMNFRAICPHNHVCTTLGTTVQATTNYEGKYFFCESCLKTMSIKGHWYDENEVAPIVPLPNFEEMWSVGAQIACVPDHLEEPLDMADASIHLGFIQRLDKERGDAFCRYFLKDVEGNVTSLRTKGGCERTALSLLVFHEFTDQRNIDAMLDMFDAEKEMLWVPHFG